MGITDDKDVSRTLRTKFTDGILVSHDTRQLMEKRFLMDKSLYKGHLAWLLLRHFLQFNVNRSIFGSLQLTLYMFDNIFSWHTYFVKNYEVFVFLKIGNLVNTCVNCHQRRGPRGEAVRRQRGCPPGPGVQRYQRLSRQLGWRSWWWEWRILW